MEHYYTPPEFVTSDKLTIVDEEARHLSKVLRKKTDDEIFVTDGVGNLYKSRIVIVGKKNIECSVIEKITSTNEPETKVHLFLCTLKSPSRFEYAIEKSVELGVSEITPVVSEFVISKSKGNIKRWQAISLSAMKQSQRVHLPRVNSPVKFAEVVVKCKSDLKLIAHEREFEMRLPAERTGNDKFEIKKISRTSVYVFIGPEGGFSEKEIHLALENDFKILNLGKRKFRSETAAIAALSLMLIS